MFGAILKMINGRRAERREDARFETSRQDALAAEQRQLEYNRAATAEQRQYDESRYATERADALADVENQFVNLRAAAEKGGFNPLAVLGMGATPAPVSGRSGVPLAPAAQSIGYVPPTDYMGSALAEAGLALSDSFARSAFMRNAGKLEANRERLRKTKEAMQRDTIRPKVGGVYAQREQTPTKAEALGRTDGDRFGSPGWEKEGRFQRPNDGHPLAGSLGHIAVPDPTLDRGSGLYAGGLRLEAPPGWSNGQQQENELGEGGPANWAFSIPFGIAYAAHNANRAAESYGVRVRQWAFDRRQRAFERASKRNDPPRDNKRAVRQGWQDLNGYRSGDSRR